LTIFYLDEVDSTQSYLKDSLKSGSLCAPVAVCAKKQTAGKGSRGNSWIGVDGNLFFSFALSLREIPSDLKIESASIYFSFILKEVLAQRGSKLWMKWPNDFYIDSSKIGGTITNIQGDNLVCGIGLNLASAPDGFKCLDIEVSVENILNDYFNYLKKKIEWKQIFSKYKLEFCMSKSYVTHSENSEISLSEACLQDDGSIVSNGQRIFSLR
jgi:BirA family biotin operon repressor/biotin-[acetyl-CoA-carboxylase] ligase